MKLEDQVCSLELAKRLKELGVKQDSLFYWDCIFGSFTLWKIGDVVSWNYQESYGEEGGDGKPTGNACSAFTVAELLFKLPRGFAVGSQFFKSKFECFPIFPAATSDDEAKELEKFQKVPFDEEENPANVAAKMLIYLIEQGLVRP